MFIVLTLPYPIVTTVLYEHVGSMEGGAIDNAFLVQQAVWSSPRAGSLGASIPT